MRYWRVVVALVLAAWLISLVNAAAFVYYPATVNVSPVAPPVTFKMGDNAGKDDLGGNTISVTIGGNNTSLEVTVHPTYQKTYYKEVANITVSGAAVYAAVRVKKVLTGFSKAYMIVRDSAGNEVMEVDLTSSGLQGWPTTLSLGDYSIDFEFVIPEGAPLPSGTANIELVYSPQSTESPP